MAKKTTRRTTKTSDNRGREFILAGIGAVSLTRKQAIRAYSALVAEGSTVRARIETGATELRGQIEGRAKQVRKDLNSRIKPVFTQINDRVEPIINIISTRAETVGNDIQARLLDSPLKPLLAKMGVEAKKKPAARKAKPAAKRTTRKAAPRKAAKKAA